MPRRTKITRSFFVRSSTLGSWDVKVRYRLGGGHELSFVFMGPWEDGSGIGRDNGADGLWGLYYHNSGERPLLAAAGVEYLDFRNTSSDKTRCHEILW